ncbi:hypothetical protein GC163_02475 [bacterium]|nr:hypothetical protein [bacterium]
MSSIGSAGFGNIPLVGSVAGSNGQQRVAGANQAAGEAAQRAAEQERAAQFERLVNDISASEGTSSDRDANGRQAWRWIERPQAEEPKDEQKAPQAIDPDEEHGGLLDLQA